MLQAKERVQYLWIWVLIAFALLSWAMVSLGRSEPIQQILIALAFISIPLALFVYLIKPHVVINLFIFAIPLLIGREVIAGLNLGEIATFFVISLGFITLFVSREKLIPALKQLGSLIWPLIGLAIVGLISALVNSVASLPEVVAAVFKPLAFAIVTLLVFVHNDSQKKTLGLIRALLLGGFAVAVYSIFSYAMGWSYYPQYGYSRAAGTFEHWNQLGGYMVLISVPTLAYALSVKRFWVRAIFIVAFVAEVVALLLSLTLGSLLALSISGFIALFVLFKFSAKRTVIFTFLLALAFISVWLTNPLLEARLGQVSERVLDRLRTYTAGLRLARDHIWFGLGSMDRVMEAILYDPAGYRFTPFGETSVIPHNSFLSVWTEKGIFGLFLFIMIVLNSLRLLLSERLLERSHYYLLHWGIIIGLLGFLIQNMSNNLLLHPRLGFIFFALVVMDIKIKQLA